VIGWLDLSAGVSGDMLLGALVDAGVDVGVLDAVIAPLGLGVSLRAAQASRGGLRATKVDVVWPGGTQPHRSLADVEVLLGQVADGEIRAGAVAVFRRIAQVEARAHGVAIQDVHFHEVGALDAIADVVGVIAGFASLGLTELHAGPIALGSGRVSAAHGSLPVPVPAVLGLAAGFPVEPGPAPFESATPTGVALVGHLVTSWSGQPAMMLDRVGVGAGGHDPVSHPNVTRLVLGSADAVASDSGSAERWHQIECNVDDMDPRLWPVALDALLAAGAADAWLTAIQMKKGRPATTCHALCAATSLDAVQRAMFTHTTTIGVRVHEVAKRALDRSVEHVEVAGQRIRVKLSSLDGVEVNRSVEWDDVVAAADALGRAPRSVLAAAEAATRQP
jgi:uncharacterized protein (TIGR00299 family) protein